MGVVISFHLLIQNDQQVFQIGNYFFRNEKVAFQNGKHSFRLGKLNFRN